MTAAFIVLGCNVNKTDSNAISSHFIKNGISTIRDAKSADIVVINSCIVTEESARKSRQALRRVRRENPAAVIVLAGCMPRVDFDEQKFSQADIVVKNNDFCEISSRIFEFMGKKNIVKTACESSMVAGKNRTRAYIKIQDGCNNFCAYCIIPHARGVSRSRPLNEIIEEAKSLAVMGFRDITLVGINLACYGLDLGDVGLIDAVLSVADLGFARVRLGSLEPDKISEKLIEDLAKISNFCPHFHISLQSGCDSTLKRMNRRYLTADYAKICLKIREEFENPAITTDVMVGFPGETDEEFSESLEFVKQIALSSAHIFSYSKRPSTKAYDMKNQIDENVKIMRNKAMREISYNSQSIYLKSFLGKRENVLIENCKGDNLYIGLNERGVQIKLKSDEKIERGEIIAVQVIGIEKDYLIGEIC